MISPGEIIVIIASESHEQMFPFPYLTVSEMWFYVTQSVFCQKKEHNELFYATVSHFGVVVMDFRDLIFHFCTWTALNGTRFKLQV